MQIDWSAIWTVFFAGASVALGIVIAIGGLVFLIMKLMLKPVVDTVNRLESQINSLMPKVQSEVELKSLIDAQVNLAIDRHEEKCPMKK